MDATQIGARLRIARMNAELTQQELADRSGVHMMQINRYENGRAMPNVESLYALAEALDVSVDYVLARTDDPRGMVNESDLAASELRILALIRKRDLPALLRVITNIADDTQQQGITGPDKPTFDQDSGGGR